MSHCNSIRRAELPSGRLPAPGDIENLQSFPVSGSRGAQAFTTDQIPHFSLHHTEPKGSRGPGRVSPEQVSPAHPQMPWHPEFSGALTGFSPGNLGRSTRREARNLGAHSRPTSCSHALRDRDKLALCMGTLALTRGGPNPARRHSQVPLRGCEPGLDLPGSWPLTPCPH